MPSRRGIWASVALQLLGLNLELGLDFLECIVIIGVIDPKEIPINTHMGLGINHQRDLELIYFRNLSAQTINAVFYCSAGCHIYLQGDPHLWRPSPIVLLSSSSYFGHLASFS